jgi:hypothetical protein
MGDGGFVKFLCGLLALVLAGTAAAQKFPRRPVRSLPPGGSPDLTACTIAAIPAAFAAG